MNKAFGYIRIDERGKPDIKIKPYLNPAIEKNLKKLKRILQKEISKKCMLSKGEENAK